MAVIDLMPGIIDIASAVSRYINIISVMPTTLYVIFVYVLIESGSGVHLPNWTHAFTSLVHLGIGGIALLIIIGFGLGVIIHPIQFAITQFFQGNWGSGRIAQAIRSQRIIRYQYRARKLNAEVDSINDQLVDWHESGMETTLSVRAPLRSRFEEALRRRDTSFPPDLDQVRPTRLGNVLDSAEHQAGSQYGMDAIQVVPQLLFIAPANHVEYVSNQRSQLDLAIRMAFISLAASITAVLFLWNDDLWVLIAIVPYALAYLSYLGAIVAARNYGSALDNLINLDRFTLYEQLHLELPATTKKEREANKELTALLNGFGSMSYKHPIIDKKAETTSE